MGWFGWRETTTRGVLVAGRSYDGSDLTRAQVVALCEAVDAIAKRHGAPIVAVPADTDLSDENTSDDDMAYCSLFVGVLVAEGGTLEPLPVTRDAMIAGLDRAVAIPEGVWAEISGAYDEAGGRVESENEIVLRLGCTGEMATAKLAFGALGPKGAALGGTYIHGDALDTRVTPQSQAGDITTRPHALGVHGLLVAVCSSDTAAEPIAVDDEVHEARVAQAPKGAYYLIAQHD